jgi:Fe-S cluster biogenesis protein NfuA
MSSTEPSPVLRRPEHGGPAAIDYRKRGVGAGRGARPYLIADGGDVALREIDGGNVVRLKLRGACGSCPSSATTMRMSIQRRLMDNIPVISAVERVAVLIRSKLMGLL